MRLPRRRSGGQLSAARRVQGSFRAARAAPRRPTPAGVDSINGGTNTDLCEGGAGTDVHVGGCETLISLR